MELQTSYVIYILCAQPVPHWQTQRQQSGRAGRRARSSLSVLVADSFSLDQHYVRNPHELFSKDVDELDVDWENKVTLEAHLQCAAREMPLSDEDTIYFGDGMKEICRNKLIRDEDGWYQYIPLTIFNFIDQPVLKVPHTPQVSAIPESVRLYPWHSRGHIHRRGCNSSRKPQTTRGDRVFSCAF